MATLALSAVGMAVGGSIGGSVLGLSMATIGRAAGAMIGRQLDQKLLGGGSEPIETGRVDRFRITGANEGADVQQIFGRLRVPGHVIWASQFKESSKTTGGSGKGGRPPEPEVTTYSYTVSMAVALCEGEISRIGRVWADGVEMRRDRLNMRVYTGSEDQLPDPKISAVEGAENAPAYRGTAYVVFEDLALGQFGNRIPQFSFEVAKPDTTGQGEYPDLVKGVAVIPGTGEYALSTRPIYLTSGFGKVSGINTNSPMARSDFRASLDALEGELPQCKSAVLVVSWFGDDLRCNACSIQPKVEQKQADASKMPWQVSGQTRQAATQVPYQNGQPVYGGSPTDQSVVQAIKAMRDAGIAPVFYPFILMDQLAGNTLPDPWTGEIGQPALPWRGRMTTSLAPAVAGSPDGTAAATAEVDTFMGNVAVTDFAITGETVAYSGPNDWGYRRFILHYAHLCAAAGGVDAFCIGSEMRGLTQIRGANDSFPTVEAFRTLAAEVRAILGPDCKISYAADWSEYHGYQPAGTGDKFFHLDALWADDNIDFIGVDNYMPLSDWREGEAHADSAAGAIYDLDYLTSNVAGGEGYDWFYATPEARDAQRRTPITDSQGEPWVWRYKDFAGWWNNPHHNRVNGARANNPTAWVPRSKPIWFTEFGCAAIDKGTNQPNKFLDPKSSESQLPHYSTGNRDDFIQLQYLRAITTYYTDPANNPVSTEYDGPMIDTSRMHVWAWDARPYPFFPGNQALWADGDNYPKGHWLNGRATNRSLASVVAEICQKSGVQHFDVTGLYGVVRGYSVQANSTARAALQPLMVAYGFEAREREGVLVFQNRGQNPHFVIDDDVLAIDEEQDTPIALTRDPDVETADRVQLGFLAADGNFDAAAVEVVHPNAQSSNVSKSEMPLALTQGEAQAVVSRWMEEARIAKDTARFALPPSVSDIGAGDVVTLDLKDHQGTYRIDRLDEAGLRLAEATRIEPEVYRAQPNQQGQALLAPYLPPLPVELVFLDLPLLTGDELPSSPHVAVTAANWPGTVALYGAAQDSGYVLQKLLAERAVMGLSQTGLLRGPVGIWDRQEGFEVELVSGALSSVSVAGILAGANTLAIGDGTPDLWEILQFREAIPVAENRFALRGLLRGQQGSHGLMPDIWPPGSTVVLLDGTPEQVVIPSAARGTERHFRFGPAKAPIDAESYRYEVRQFQGNGLRPYPVVHLRAQRAAGATVISWLRCTRIDGDLWSTGDVPLGEDRESYMVRVIENGELRREETVSQPTWTYPDADALADVGTAPYAIEVAQLSERFGPGPFRRIVMNA